MKRFRAGLAFKARRLLYHSTLGSRVMQKKKRRSILKYAHYARWHGQGQGRGAERNPGLLLSPAWAGTSLKQGLAANSFGTLAVGSYETWVARLRGFLGGLPREQKMLASMGRCAPHPRPQPRNLCRILGVRARVLRV